MDEVDIYVPINHIPDVLDRVDELEKEIGMRIPNFGHAGDGNLHIYLCSDNMSDEEYKEKSDKVITELYKTAKALDGTCLVNMVLVMLEKIGSNGTMVKTILTY